MNMTAEEAYALAIRGWNVGSCHKDFNPSRTAWMQWLGQPVTKQE